MLLKLFKDKDLHEYKMTKFLINGHRTIFQKMEKTIHSVNYELDIKY